MADRTEQGRLIALEAIVTFLVQRILRSDEDARAAQEIVTGAIESYYEGRTISPDRHRDLQTALAFAEEMLAPDRSKPQADL